MNALRVVLPVPASRCSPSRSRAAGSRPGGAAMSPLSVLLFAGSGRLVLAVGVASCGRLTGQVASRRVGSAFLLLAGPGESVLAVGVVCGRLAGRVVSR
jgi:hypothetical protein